MALNIDIRPGETLQIGDITISMVKKSGQLARLVINADKSVEIKHVTPSNTARPMRLVASQG